MLHVHLDKWVELIVAQLDVVARLQLLDQVRLDEQRLQFRAEHPRLDLTHTLQQPIHLACIAKWLTIVGRQALAQVLRLADVDHLAGLVFHQVDAGSLGEGLAPCGIEVEPARWPVRRQGILGGRDAHHHAPQVVECAAAFLTCARQQEGENLRGEQRIRQRSVARMYRNVQGSGNSVQPSAPHAGEVAASERNRVDALEREYLGHTTLFGLVVEETQVETHIVADDWPSADELAQPRQDRASGRSLLDHGCANPGELTDETRYRAPGVDQLLKLRAQLAA